MNNETAVICNWIRNNCLQDSPATQLSGGTLLLEEIGLDSLEIVRLVNFLEDEFNISVDVEELVPENFESVDRVVAMLTGLTRAESAALVSSSLLITCSVWLVLLLSLCEVPLLVEADTKAPVI